MKKFFIIFCFFALSAPAWALNAVPEKILSLESIHFVLINSLANDAFKNAKEHIDVSKYPQTCTDFKSYQSPKYGKYLFIKDKNVVVLYDKESYCLKRIIIKKEPKICLSTYFPEIWFIYDNVGDLYKIRIYLGSNDFYDYDINGKITKWTPYLKKLRTKINSNFVEPPKLENPRVSAKVAFSLNAYGGVDDIVILKSSGDDEYDNAVKTAILKSIPFAPMPDFKSADISFVLYRKYVSEFQIYKEF